MAEILGELAFGILSAVAESFFEGFFQSIRYAYNKLFGSQPSRPRQKLDTQQESRQDYNQPQKHNSVVDNDNLEAVYRQGIKATHKPNSTALAWALFVTVNQGFIGITTFNGVLSPNLLEPGLHFKWPLLQTLTQVNISPETTRVSGVLCGTAGGMTIRFDHIDIVSRLQKSSIYQTVKNYSSSYNQLFVESNARHRMGEICSKYQLNDIYVRKFDQLDEQLKQLLTKDLQVWAPGIKIMDIRITKPKLPQSIRRNYEEVQELKGQYLLAVQQQKNTMEKLQNQGQKEFKQAESNFEVRLIELKKEIQHKQNQLKLQEIQTQMTRASQFNLIDNEFMMKVKQIQAQQSQFSREFLHTHMRECLANVQLRTGNGTPQIDIGN